MTRKRVHYLGRNLGHVMKFMCSEYEFIMIYGYDDMIERVIFTKWRLHHVMVE